MIAFNKIDKAVYMNHLKLLLWTGNTVECLIYLYNISSKNDEKKQELRDYLEKHQAEIINYGLRICNEINCTFIKNINVCKLIFY